MGNAYARTAYRCGQLLDQTDGTLRQYWCGYRWCAACGAIRTARAIAAYGPQVSQWKAAQLVTLTVPNVSGGALRQTVRDMHHAFATLTRAMRRRFGRDGLRMIRTTEVTYNSGSDSYHPHMHLLVDGAVVAEILRDEWLVRWPTARRVAQDVRPADKGSVLEVFKYATKVATQDGKVVPLVALDTIYTALRGLRLWQPVGITAVADEAAGDDTAAMDQTEGTPATTRPAEAITWVWQQGVCDWVDGVTGECLTGYTPTTRRAAFLATLDRMASEVDTARPARPALPPAAFPAALPALATTPVEAPATPATALAAVAARSAVTSPRMERPAASLAVTRSPHTHHNYAMRGKQHDTLDYHHPPPLTQRHRTVSAA
jgi:hypothetical protein